MRHATNCDERTALPSVCKRNLHQTFIKIARRRYDYALVKSASKRERLLKIAGTSGVLLGECIDGSTQEGAQEINRSSQEHRSQEHRSQDDYDSKKGNRRSQKDRRPEEKRR